MSAWTAVLGADRCIAGADPRAGAYAHDVAEFARREIAAILYPASAADVQAIVRIANAERMRLYSLSTGKNWGLGSRQPVEDGGVIVDLGRMNRIRAINVEERYAIVEPGVTQEALSVALADTTCIANLTASTPQSSLIGNILDKGIGMHRHRVDDLLGIEAVTGYGELIHAGGYWPTGSAMFHFPSGLGPTLTPLFLQSNFGIVTACAIRLMPRPELVDILYATVSADELVPALAVVKRLRAERALDCVVKFYNAQAFHAYSGGTAAPGDRTFHVLAAVHGSAAWVRHVSPFVAESLREARCFDHVALLDRDAVAGAPELIQALAGVFAGSPTDFAVRRAFALRDAAECGELDRVARAGFLFVIPIVPATSDAVLRALGVFATLSKQHDMPINTTINLISEHAVELVSSMLFSRAPDRIARAHGLKKALVEEMRRQDVPLMRLDVDTQDDAGLFTQPSYRDALVRLKRLFDPGDIIAPGRYIPRA